MTISPRLVLRLLFGQPSAPFFAPGSELPADLAAADRLTPAVRALAVLSALALLAGLALTIAAGDYSTTAFAVAAVCLAGGTPSLRRGRRMATWLAVASGVLLLLSLLVLATLAGVALLLLLAGLLAASLARARTFARWYLGTLAGQLMTYGLIESLPAGALRQRISSLVEAMAASA